MTIRRNNRDWRLCEACGTSDSGCKTAVCTCGAGEGQAARARARADGECECTGRKTDSARQPGPASRAQGRTPVPPPHRRRWVPPSTLRDHDAPEVDAKHDVIFRKVRGILNKLTPEKFQKLSDDLLALELDSDKVLKGVILLIFEKALDEPKYSSMYAQLCKRLSEEAPNFEPQSQPCTFKLLLLNKCRTEFENRAQAFAAYEGRSDLAPEEEEKRHLAKCKMLGNIKFIGELGKLEILAESILHRCIQNLLARRAAAEHHEDLECLAQLVRTCGRVLDSERGRGLMDQYFARIETLSTSRELAPRIRFMLRDVAELRRGRWVPRAAAALDPPVPIHQLRADDEPRLQPHRDRDRDRDRDSLFRAGLRSRPLDDVLAGLALQPAAPLVPQDKLFGNGFGRDYRQRSAPSYYTRPPQHYQPKHSHQNASKQEGNRSGRGGGGGTGGGGTGGTRLPAGGALADVQMRPAANSLLFQATKLSREPVPTLQPNVHNVLAPATFASAPLVKEPALTVAIKPAPDAKQKPKKDKGMNKEEACRLVTEAVDELAAAGEGAEGEGAADGSPAARRLQDLQLPDKLLRRAISAALEHALNAEVEESAEGGCNAHAAAASALVRSIKRAPVGDALRALAAARHPHARLPALLAHTIKEKLVTLAEVGSWCEGGALHPLLLQVLQELSPLLGMERLHQLYTESKINLAAYVQAAEAEGGGGGGGGGAGVGAEGGVLAALEARGLAALVPQLRVQAQLARQLQHEPTPHLLYRWIKANVEPSVRQNAAFVSTLVMLVARHVTAAAGSADKQPDKAALEKEKALVETYAPLLTALLEGRADLQLAAVYAVQLHAHHHRYPKGMLLRWFMYLYNLEVCEEEAFLRWREDVTDVYPGKGEALFQVNTWLTWLQQQESEDEEAED